MEDGVNHQIERIARDKTSGSKELLLKLHFILKDSREDLTLSLIEKLKERFGSFQSITSYLGSLIDAVKEDELDQFFSSFDKYYGSLYDTIFDNFKTAVKGKNTLLTISNSTTIYEVLKRYGEVNEQLKIIICEGRPLLEGRLLAEKLAVNGIETILITEAQAFQFMEEVDAVIIGADKLLPDGNVVNKVGSNNLAVLAKHSGKPFYVVADNSKLSDTDSYNEDEKDSAEIWDGKPEIIKITNKYFEVLDKKFVTEMITD